MNWLKHQSFVSVSLLVALSFQISNLPGAQSFSTPVQLHRFNAPLRTIDDPEGSARGVEILNKRNQTADLLSFLYNIQKNRRKIGAPLDRHSRSPRRCQPVYALARYLSSSVVEMGDGIENNHRSIELALCRAVVQGIRLAKSENDYKLIVKLVDSTIQFASAQPVIQPRIMGEAIEAMVETSVNLGKMKRIWNLLSHDGTSSPSYLTAPPGPIETNAVVKAFTNRGKIRAAVDLVRKMWRSNQIDSYTLSILFDGLTRSLEPDQRPQNSAPIFSVRQFRSLVSPCWQWNEAISLLDRIASESPSDSDMLNNHVYSALLKLNVRAGEMFPNHDAARYAAACLEWMRTLQTPLDHVTCSFLISGFGSQWKSALSFHQDMKDHNGTNGILLLPKPNVYTYSAAISACAKDSQYEPAIRLLEELQDDHECDANTMVYNAVLQSLATAVPGRRWNSKKPTRRMRVEARRRVRLALPIFVRMRSDAALGNDSKPDNATYNILLALFRQWAPFLQVADWAMFQNELALAFGTFKTAVASCAEDFPRLIMDRMIEDGVPVDTHTYRLALPVCQSFDVFLRIFDEASRCTSSCSESKTQLLNSALPHAALLGGMGGLRTILHRALARKTAMNSETVTKLIHSLGHCKNTAVIPQLIYSMNRTGGSELFLQEATGTLPLKNLPPLIKEQFEIAVITCLRGKDMESARSIIKLMDQMEIEISPVVYREVARMYAAGALQHRKHGQNESKGIDSSVHARMAYNVFRSMSDPPLWLAVMIAKSLAKVELFDLAEDALVEVHRLAKTSRATPLLSRDADEWHHHVHLKSPDALRVKSLHAAVLRGCASCGNVTAALRFCEEIQSFSKSIQETGLRLPHSEELSLNMNAIEWKLLLLAAMKSGHWRLCLSTLQFLQPCVEALRPKNSSNAKPPSQMNREFYELSSALNIAVRCLATRGQYGWIIRVLEDWISWSCRRPPKQAAFLAIRALCARGRGVEVGSLIVRCLTPEYLDPSREGHTYEIALLVFAITCLYNEGLYDAADDVFLTAVSSYSLPFELWEEVVGSRRKVTLDLHGMNVAVAHSAVRIALRREAREVFQATTNQPGSDLLIVTGRGRSSLLRMRPILRPEVQRMLVEEFYPPLSSSSIPGNMGAILVPANDIDTWLTHQREAKRSQVMAVAAVLKKLSSNAIRAAVTLSTTGVSDGHKTR